MAEQVLQVLDTAGGGGGDDNEEDLMNSLNNMIDEEQQNTTTTKPSKQSEDDDEEDLINGLMTDIAEEEQQRGGDTATDTRDPAQKKADIQRKYFETILEIFTELDLTEIDKDDDHQIDLQELKDYITANHLAIPLYLVENIFRSIDDNGNDFITPIELLVWKTMVTVDDIARLTAMTSTVKPPEPLQPEPTHTPSVDPEDSDVDEENLFGMVDKMHEADEKKQMDAMMVMMEQKAGERRKQLSKEEEERKKYAEQQRLKADQERTRFAAQQAEIAAERKKLNLDRRRMEQEQHDKEREEKKRRLRDLGRFADDGGKDPDKDNDDASASGGSGGDDDLDFNFDTSSSDEDREDDDDANKGRATHVLHEDNACVKCFPCFRKCSCCKPKILRQRSEKSQTQSKEKDVPKIIQATKRRLSKFILRHGDVFVDDDASELPKTAMPKLTKEINFDDKMGVYFWAMVLDKQSQKQYGCLWPVLRFLGHELPTPVSVELMRLYREELFRYPLNKVEGIAAAITESSEFSIATALVFATYFEERSQKDLANRSLLEDYSVKYQNWASEELRNIESDYLASMSMMTKSFHAQQTPFEIAVDNELIEFLSSDRMARIGNAIWVKRELLRPEISEDSFEVHPTGIAETVKVLASPQDFYFTPIGFHFTEKFLFYLYLAIFTAVTIYNAVEARHVCSELRWMDWLLYCSSVGYLFNELFQFFTEGPSKYFQTWENLVDLAVSVIWILIIFVHLLFGLVLRGVDGSLCGGDADAFNTEQLLNLLFQFLWVINIILLWIRCLHFLKLSNQEGPLINTTKSMGHDVKNWLYVFTIISIGFVFGMKFLAGDRNVYLSTEQRAISFTILAAIGQPNWYHATGDDPTDIFNVLNSWILVIYSIIGFVTLINLLIAMMADTYARTTGRSAKEVLLNKVSLAFELDTAPKIMPPPLNSILLIVFVLYNIIDVLVLAFTAQFINEQGFQKYWRCRNKDCRFLNPRSIIDKEIKQGWDQDFPCALCDQDHPMDDIFKSSKRRLRRKARGLEGDKKKSCCARLGHGVKEIFVYKTKWKKHSWICGYCRSRLPANYGANLDRYFERLRATHNLDQNDVNWIKSRNPQLCPFCYRPRRPRARATYTMENISYLIFVCLVWPLMWLLLWPVFLYDSITNPNRAEPDYKDFRKKHNKLYSLRPEASTVRKHMPPSHLHQSLVSLHHPIWRLLHKHRSTAKGQTLAQGIWSANLRQEKVREQNVLDKREAVGHITDNVLQVVSSMANNRIKWQPTNAELLERMSQISGVNIDANWYDRHKTMREEKAQKDRMLLEYEATGGKGRAQKFSARHLRQLSSKGTGYSMGSSDLNLKLKNVVEEDEEKIEQ